MKFGISLHLQSPRDPERGDEDPGSEAAALARAVEQVVLADSLGLDYAFLVEHHFLDQYSLASAPEVFHSYVAARTRRIRLGFGVVQMEPRLVHPAKIAGRLATLDLLSAGRVEFGAGSPGTPAERERFGLAAQPEPGAWKASTRECLGLLAGTPAGLVPRPFQRPHPPVWRAVSSEAGAVDAARLGVGSLGLGAIHPEAVAARVTRYWSELLEGRERLGPALSPATAIFANLLCLPTTEEALARGARDADYFAFASREAGRHPHLARAYGEAPADVLPADPARSPARILLGSPARLREVLRALEASRLDLVLLQIQTGFRPHELVLESLERFAREVMPEFAARHPAHQAWRAERLARLGAPVIGSI